MLPIQEVLEPLKAALADHASAVLVAPPGAGKTTVVPLALIDEAWTAGGRLIMLEPRRLAARAAASRMAATLGEPVGETVGFRVRLQSKVSARTRIEVVTEGIFTRMILDDPALEGVAGVIFDEFHERSLDADLGLAFARDAQTVLRPDLRLLVMSATLDGAAVARLLGDAPVIESAGRQFPVETKYLSRIQTLRLEDQVARAVQMALRGSPGGVLVFLPGQGEINRVAERLREAIDDPDLDVFRLYSALDAGEQDRAIEPSPPGRRKVVLATTIAQTSLTLEGVRIVVDSGLARAPKYDPATGVTRLVTRRVSRASADQRRGRAGRTEPGVCYRLWDEPETRALLPFDPPEILESDLSRLLLDLARWGARSPADMALLDAPPAGALDEARLLLQRLTVLDQTGGLTAHGRAVAELPLSPRLGHMLIAGARRGQSLLAAEIAALLSDPGVGGSDVDLRHRLERMRRDSSARARDARRLAERWVGMAKGKRSVEEDPARLLAEAFPERIARARGGAGEFLLANGRGAYLEPADALAREPWLAVAELAGGGPRDRIRLAAPIDEATVHSVFGDRIVTEDRLDRSPTGRLQARRVRKLGAIVISEQALEAIDPALMHQALLEEVRATGLSALPWTEAATALRARVAMMRSVEGDVWPDLSDAALMEALEVWLPPLLEGKRRLADVAPADLVEALLSDLPWDRRQALDRLAPERWSAPTGSRFLIDYGAEGGPTVSVRVQELFGLTEHPLIAGGRVPLVLALLSPAHRPIQVTRDLPGFWRGSWKDVRSDMRGRYPKHSWPEDPAAAPPTTRAKPRI
jgi:ATP-dependent helicase HrpB